MQRDTTAPGLDPAANQTANPEVEPVRLLIPSPLGSIGIELREHMVTGLTIVPKGKERRTFLAFTSIKRSDQLDEIIGNVSEYLAGARKNLRLDYALDTSQMDGFTRRVFRETAKIPFGKTRSYQDVARAAGRPNAYRQVLSILMANPIPLVIPCHRVIPSKTGSGSYVAGVKKKDRLLKMEREALKEDA